MLSNFAWQIPPWKPGSSFSTNVSRHQVSIKAGTVFHKLRQPLRKLFLAVYLVATGKKGLSMLDLQRKVAIKSYRSAWMLLHKIRCGMSSSGQFRLSGVTEVDENFVGGQPDSLVQVFSQRATRKSTKSVGRLYDHQACVKHWLCGNSIKTYNKRGFLIRIQVLRNPRMHENCCRRWISWSLIWDCGCKARLIVILRRNIFSVTWMNLNSDSIAVGIWSWS